MDRLQVLHRIDRFELSINRWGGAGRTILTSTEYRELKGIILDKLAEEDEASSRFQEMEESVDDLQAEIQDLESDNKELRDKITNIKAFVNDID